MAVGPVSLLGSVEQWLVTEWQKWPGYLRAISFAVAGAVAAHWLW
jgi:hypothetical protein